MALMEPVYEHWWMVDGGWYKNKVQRRGQPCVARAAVYTSLTVATTTITSTLKAPGSGRACHKYARLRTLHSYH